MAKADSCRSILPLCPMMSMRSSASSANWHGMLLRHVPRSTKLRFQLARFKRAQFGCSSEKIDRTIEQLELAIETLDEDHAQRIAAIPAVAEQSRQQANKPPSRRDDRCPNICRARRLSIPAPAAVRTVAAHCAGSAPT